MSRAPGVILDNATYTVAELLARTGISRSVWEQQLRPVVPVRKLNRTTLFVVGRDWNEFVRGIPPDEKKAAPGSSTRSGRDSDIASLSSYPPGSSNREDSS